MQQILNHIASECGDLGVCPRRKWPVQAKTTLSTHRAGSKHWKRKHICSSVCHQQPLWYFIKQKGQSFDHSPFRASLRILGYFEVSICQLCVVGVLGMFQNKFL